MRDGVSVTGKTDHQHSGGHDANRVDPVLDIAALQHVPGICFGRVTCRIKYPGLRRTKRSDQDIPSRRLTGKQRLDSRRIDRSLIV